MKKPRLSIIITCYREGELLREALSSVLSQLQDGMELLVVNDASPDEMTNNVCRWANGRGVRLVWHKQNRGLSGARNTGAMEAQGEVLCFLDGDDRFPPGALIKLRAFFASEPQADFIVSDYRKIDRRGELLGEVRMDGIFEEGNLSPKLLLKDWYMLGTSPLRKSLWRKLGGYDESQWLTNSVQDIDFFLRAFAAGARAMYVPEVCYEWRMSAESMHVTQQHSAHDLLTIKNRKILASILGQSPQAMANRGMHSLYAHGDWRNFRKFYQCLVGQVDWNNHLRFFASLVGLRLGKEQSRSSIALSALEIDRIMAGASFAHFPKKSAIKQ